MSLPDRKRSSSGEAIAGKQPKKAAAGPAASRAANVDARGRPQQQKEPEAAQLSASPARTRTRCQHQEASAG